MDSNPKPARILLVLLAAMLGSCAGDRSLFPGSDSPAPARPAAPPVNMAGRWILTSPGRGQCQMTFGAAPGAPEGTIAPAGGCPGQFYTSRKWSFDSTGLVISNHNGQPLGKLSAAGETFAGQSTAGEPLTLTR